MLDTVEGVEVGLQELQHIKRLKTSLLILFGGSAKEIDIKTDTHAETRDQTRDL